MFPGDVAATAGHGGVGTCQRRHSMRAAVLKILHLNKLVALRRQRHVSDLERSFRDCTPEAPDDEEAAFIGRVLSSPSLMRRACFMLRPFAAVAEGAEGAGGHLKILSIAARTIHQVKVLTARTAWKHVLEIVAPLRCETDMARRRHQALQRQFNETRVAYLKEVVAMRDEIRVRGDPESVLQLQCKSLDVTFFLDPMVMLLPHELDFASKVVAEKLKMIFEANPTVTTTIDSGQVDKLMEHLESEELQRLRAALKRKTEEVASIKKNEEVREAESSEFTVRKITASYEDELREMKERVREAEEALRVETQNLREARRRCDESGQAVARALELHTALEEALRGSHNELRATRSELRAAEERGNRLAEEARLLQNENDALEEAARKARLRPDFAAQFQEARALLSEELARSTMLAARVTELEAECRLHEEEISKNCQLTTRVAELEAELEAERQRLQAERQRLQAECQRLQEELYDLQQLREGELDAAAGDTLPADLEAASALAMSLTPDTGETIADLEVRVQKLAHEIDKKLTTLRWELSGLGGRRGEAELRQRAAVIRDLEAELSKLEEARLIAEGALLAKKVEEQMQALGAELNLRNAQQVLAACKLRNELSGLCGFVGQVTKVLREVSAEHARALAVLVEMGCQVQLSMAALQSSAALEHDEQLQLCLLNAQRAQNTGASADVSAAVGGIRSVFARLWRDSVMRTRTPLEQEDLRFWQPPPAIRSFPAPSRPLTAASANRERRHSHDKFTGRSGLEATGCAFPPAHLKQCPAALLDTGSTTVLQLTAVEQDCTAREEDLPSAPAELLTESQRPQQQRTVTQALAEQWPQRSRPGSRQARGRPHRHLPCSSPSPTQGHKDMSLGALASCRSPATPSPPMRRPMSGRAFRPKTAVQIPLGFSRQYS